MHNETQGNSTWDQAQAFYVEIIVCLDWRIELLEATLISHISKYTIVEFPQLMFLKVQTWIDCHVLLGGDQECWVTSKPNCKLQHGNNHIHCDGQKYDGEVNLHLVKKSPITNVDNWMRNNAVEQCASYNVSQPTEATLLHVMVKPGTPASLKMAWWGSI